MPAIRLTRKLATERWRACSIRPSFSMGRRPFRAIYGGAGWLSRNRCGGTDFLFFLSGVVRWIACSAKAEEAFKGLKHRLYPEQFTGGFPEPPRRISAPKFFPSIGPKPWRRSKNRTLFSCASYTLRSLNAGFIQCLPHGPFHSGKQIALKIWAALLFKVCDSMDHLKSRRRRLRYDSQSGIVDMLPFFPMYRLTEN